MSKIQTRRDSWTEKEDQLLATIVLKHLSGGSTQIKAFEEVKEQLSRTTAACAYRWNSIVRKQYADEVLKAKSKKGGTPTDTVERIEYPQLFEELSLPIVIEYLHKVEEQISGETKAQNIEGQLQQERKEKEDIQIQYNKLYEEYQTLKMLINQVRQAVDVPENNEVVETSLKDTVLI